MKVTLEKFLDIVGESFIETYLCEIYVDEYDEDFEEYFPKKEVDCVKNLNQLNPYMNYEIYGFDQKVEWGEIVLQTIWLRE